MTTFNKVRALRALNMHRNGTTFKDIGKEFDVCLERGRQLVMRGAEIERRMLSTNPWDELTSRCRNALVNDGCEPTPDGVVRHFKTHDWKRTVAFGVKSLAELNAWLERHGREPIR